jgi:ArsR family transcriptional regulator
MISEFQVAARIFKALADENRMHILKSLGSSEKCACELLKELKITQSTLSHHMKILCESGLVVGRREGKWMYYRICCENVQKLRTAMHTLLASDQILPYCADKTEQSGREET